MNMKCDVTKFLSYLSIERSCAASTIHDYDKELTRLDKFLAGENTNDPNSVTISLLREYLYFSKESRKLSQTSISKVIAIVKSFFNYLEEEEIIIYNKKSFQKNKSTKKNKPHSANYIKD